jgi:hypothetical protein
MTALNLLAQLYSAASYLSPWNSGRGAYTLRMSMQLDKSAMRFNKARYQRFHKLLHIIGPPFLTRCLFYF